MRLGCLESIGCWTERIKEHRYESINFCLPEVLQLIKSQKFLNKLVILVETEKEKILRKEYVFADSKVSDNRHLMWGEKGHGPCRCVVMCCQGL